jgi:ADP-ribose pyrophosphatase YjhB (NUDIX family)
VTTQHTFPVDVHLVLTRAGDVLLARRLGTGYADGLWNLPSGKVEPGEHVTAAVLRETREEIGLTLPPEAVTFAGVVHYRTPERHGRVGSFFHAEHRPDAWGEPVNAEPHKCSELRWAPLHALPAGTVPYTAEVVAQFRGGAPFGLAGW